MISVRRKAGLSQTAKEVVDQICVELRTQSSVIETGVKSWREDQDQTRLGSAVPMDPDFMQTMANISRRAAEALEDLT